VENGRIASAECTFPTRENREPRVIAPPVCLFLAGCDEGVKKFLVRRMILTHMLRMPLDTDAEGMAFMFCSFRDSVFTTGGKNQIISQMLDCLVMHTVDRQEFFLNDGMKFCAGHDGDGVAAFFAAFELGVIAALQVLDVLVQRAVEVYIHQLHTPAYTKDRLACGEKRIQNFHFSAIAQRVGLAAFFGRRLSVQVGRYISASGEEETVTGQYLGSSGIRILKIDPDYTAAGAFYRLHIFVFHIFSEQVVAHLRHTDANIHGDPPISFSCYANRN